MNGLLLCSGCIRGAWLREARLMWNISDRWSEMRKSEWMWERIEDGKSWVEDGEWSEDVISKSSVFLLRCVRKVTSLNNMLSERDVERRVDDVMLVRILKLPRIMELYNFTEYKFCLTLLTLFNYISVFQFTYVELNWPEILLTFANRKHCIQLSLLRFSCWSVQFF